MLANRSANINIWNLSDNALVPGNQSVDREITADSDSWLGALSQSHVTCAMTVTTANRTTATIRSASRAAWPA